MRRFVTTLLASLAIAPSAGLFIALLTGSLRQQRLALEWPGLIDSSGGAAAELLIATLPGMLAFLLASSFLRGRLALVASFVGCALLACIFAAFNFAQAFGNTWSSGEILLELVLAQLHLIAPALLPGALLATLLARPSSH